MISNLERYKKDLEALIKSGDQLYMSLEHWCNKEEFEKRVYKKFGDQAKTCLDSLPSFTMTYQTWYSQAKALIKQLLPDRLDDFIRHYEKPKPREELTRENYRIEDCLQRITATRGPAGQNVVDVGDAIPHFEQQRAILESVRTRFESSLFDIKQLVQADLFDSELDAARELLRQKFIRATGAVAGVVLEKHLGQVCENHSIKIIKKNPSICDLNDPLKEASVLDISQWRFVQHLGDIRNLCDHDKKAEPTAEQVEDLISGVMKIIKTVV